MKISYNWLKKYIDLTISPEELKDKLTFSGIEVENVEYLAKNLKNIYIAKIISREKHPKADKLSVCIVYDGETETQVVCGAPNCDEGNLIAFAPVGSQVFSGNNDNEELFTLGKVKLRGVESYGMICSEKELGISDNHEEILVLPEDAPIGTNLAQYFSKNDVIYDVEITPNRPDLLGTVGIARDLSALLKIPLNLPDVKNPLGVDDINNYLKLKNLNPEKCPRYTARIIKNVNVRKSPDWLVNILMSIGIKPINNIVDITNFVMFEYGHPLHAFDYEHIKGNEIVVRDAVDQEFFSSLEKKNYTLRSDDLVIADSERPIALAGVVGSDNSGITENTKTVVIEAAFFDFRTVRRTSNTYKIFTDSAYRFERNLSADTVDQISLRAVDLILQIAGGEFIHGSLDSYPQGLEDKIVYLRLKRVERILDAKISLETIIGFLENLGLTLIEIELFNNERFAYSGSIESIGAVEKQVMKLILKVPHFRKDLEREIDLIEEIVRLYGYSKISDQYYEAKGEEQYQSITNWDLFYTRRSIEDFLVNRGFQEVKNSTFSDEELIKKLNIDKDDDRFKTLKILNPLGSSFTIMRTTLIPDILKNICLNINRGQKDLSFYEIGKLYFQSENSLYKEREKIVICLTGKSCTRNWYQKERDFSFFDLKGVIEDLLSNLNINELKFKKSEYPYFIEGVSADIYFKKKKLGCIGQLEPEVLENFDVDQPVYICEVDINESLTCCYNKHKKYEELVKFPSINRDISFIVSNQVENQEIISTIKNSNPKIITAVEVIDEYKGGNIPQNFRSLAYNVTFCSEKNTLRDDFVNTQLDKIIKNLQNKFKVDMR